MGVRARRRNPGTSQPGTNLTPLPGGLPRVGEPGHTLGGRVLPGYGFEPTEGSEPITAPSPPPAAPSAAGVAANPVLGDEAAVAAGERIYRARCAVCHRTGGGASPSLFRTGLPAGRFLDAVAQGREGTNMPAFGELLSQDEIWQVHAFLMSRDAL